MKFIDIKSKKVYYNTGGDEYFITAEFWKALKADRIKYRTGGERNGILYTRILILKIGDKVFKTIALSTRGRAAMEGKVPVTTIL